jgi:di/tricarboxylate transporter
MTLSMGLLLVILATALVLFVSGWVRMDLVALLVLAALAITGLVSAEQALSGFSSPAVVTVWAMFILSAGLSKTGLAGLLGRPLQALASGGELRLMAGLMLVASVLSALVNTVTVAALLLPTTMELARRSRIPPSRLLMPMALGCLLGGPFTGISTPANILVTDALRAAGLAPFGLLSFTPPTAAIVAVGIIFTVLVGRHLLPKRASGLSGGGGAAAPGSAYGVHEHLFTARIEEGSSLGGKTLAQSRLGSAMHLTVLAIFRDGRLELAPGPDEELLAGDQLILHGHPDHLERVHGRQHLAMEPLDDAARELANRVAIAEARIPEGSPLAGATLAGYGLRRKHRVHALAVRHGGDLALNDLHRRRLEAGDYILLQGQRDALEALVDEGVVEGLRPLSTTEVEADYPLDVELLPVRVPKGSVLEGRGLAESRLGNAFGLTVAAILRGDESIIMPDPEERVEAGDLLLLHGSRNDLEVLAGLQDLEISAQTPAQVEELESQQVGVTEVVLSPRTTIAGKTLEDLRFRDRYGLTVLAVWREGRPYRTELRELALRFGDALLVYGHRRHLEAIARDPDFLVLDESAAQAPRLEKAPVAGAVMVAVLAAAMSGWLPISIAAVAGAALMVLVRCLTMEEAYRAIDWKAVFLIAGMLPMGAAIEQSGAAMLLADGMIGAVGEMGPRAVVAALFTITVLGTQVIPTAALVVLMAPIALTAAANLDISPHLLMMTVALAASASFASPISHPAHVLIMGPGGYRFVDYVKLGLPLTLLAFAVVVGLLPLLWPP